MSSSEGLQLDNASAKMCPVPPGLHRASGPPGLHRASGPPGLHRAWHSTQSAGAALLQATFLLQQGKYPNIGNQFYS